MANSGHHDGLMARFLIATPPEVYVELQDKIDASESENRLDMASILKKVSNMFSSGTTFKMDDEAMQLFSSYHDNDVLAVSDSVICDS